MKYTFVHSSGRASTLTDSIFVRLFFRPPPELNNSVESCCPRDTKGLYLEGSGAPPETKTRLPEDACRVVRPGTGPAELRILWNCGAFATVELLILRELRAGTDPAALNCEQALTPRHSAAEALTLLEL
jgi:hypothetical protein